MNKFQNIQFKSVGEFFDFLPDREKVIAEILRTIILDNIPNCREKLSYNVPYYYRQSRICFIWPSSVPWGNVKTNGVMLGFCNGNLISDEMNYLEKGNRKQVYTKTFLTISDVDQDIIKSYLFEAVKVDEMLKLK